MLKIHTLLNTGNHLEAQKLLATIESSAFTQKEKTQWRCLNAYFYQQIGAIREFVKTTQALDENDVRNNTECALMKAQALQEQEKLVEAQECLEARIELETESSALFKLYNNLATGEAIAGRRKQKVIWLERAWHEWRHAPEPEALEYLAHNLAIERVRDNDLSAAKAIIQEAFECIDKTKPEQVLMWQNLFIEVAREAGDKALLQQAYDEHDNLNASLHHTPSQKFALAVTRLRMDFNDGLVNDFSDFPFKINTLLDHIALLNKAEQLMAIKEIGHNVEQIMAARHNSQRPIEEYIQVLSRCDNMALQRADMVTAQLQTLPPSLVNQRQHWLSLLHHVEKIRIRKANIFPSDALENLFIHQRESAELHQEKGAIHNALHAWLVICDEYLAYTEQFPVPWALELQQRYEDLAITALTEAKQLLEQKKIKLGLEDAMIGVAESAMKLCNDQETARYWLQQFDEAGTSLNHYACWFREKYSWIKSAVN